MWIPSCSAPFVEKTSFPIELFCHLCQKSLDHIFMGLFLTLNSIDPYVYLYANTTLSLLQDSFLVSFERGKCEFSTFVLFLKIVLATLSPLGFHMNFNISLSIFDKNKVWILIRITLHPNLGSTAILTVFQLTNMKCFLFIWIFFHFFFNSL